jgi:hypothetical protein
MTAREKGPENKMRVTSVDRLLRNTREELAAAKELKEEKQHLVDLFA